MLVLIWPCGIVVNMAEMLADTVLILYMYIVYILHMYTVYTQYTNCKVD